MIGRMEGGGLLAVPTRDDVEIMKALANFLTPFMLMAAGSEPEKATRIFLEWSRETTPGNPADPEPPAPEKSGVAGPPRPTRSGKAARRNKAGEGFPCRVCGKPILGSRKGGRKVHPGCRKEWLQRSRREGDGKPMVAPPLNPSDPSLTDKQRKELAEQRRKLAAAD